MSTECGERSDKIIETLMEGARERWFGGRRTAERIYLYVPWEEKEEAKALGVMWDWERKQAYFFPSNPNWRVFARWIDPPDTASRGHVRLVG